MRRSRIAALVASITVATCALTALVVAACSQPPETNFGNGGQPSRADLPGDGGLETLVCTNVPEAGTADGAGGCTVSWSLDIFPKMKNESGPWKCTEALKCHGEKYQPVFTEQGGAAAAYNALKDFKLLGGAVFPLINTDAGGDPTKSTMQCNLLGQCGRAMPEPPGRTLTIEEHCMIDSWLRCGAPNN